MKALVLEEKNLPLRAMEVAHPGVGKDQVLVELKASSLNHRDVWIAKGQYPGIKVPLILGSDGAGLLDGKEVLMQPGVDWGDQEGFQGSGYQILGLPQNGTFAEEVAVRQQQIFSKPAHLSMEEAAALPLAGLTAYRVLFARCKAQPEEKVLVTGAGGGVALFCIQFAMKAGLEVYATSGSNEKIAKVKKLGAAGAANYKVETWAESLKSQSGGFDVIIDGAGGASFNQLVKLCNPGGRIGIYGGTTGPIPNFSPQPIFWKQLSIHGSTMGSDRDFVEMLDFVNLHKIVPIIDSVFRLEEGDQAFKRLEAGEQFGKIVINMA